ncbi:MAG: uracil-DNA glycosylase [Clostridia bacterium]|nr:uracil-DNA glycosylase [Clostridia bacterium]
MANTAVDTGAENIKIDGLNRDLRDFIDGIYGAHTKALVFGDGKAGSEIMLVGEAPGEQEAIRGKPFVGRAGKNLDFFLEKTGFSRDEMYITNVVKFRPVKVSKAGNNVNRAPTREEIALFLPWLRREIDIIRPRCVVALGNTALQALMGRGCVIGDAHGTFHKAGDILVFAIYHPASIIYNRSLADAYEADLRTLALWRQHLTKTPN